MLRFGYGYLNNCINDLVRVIIMEKSPARKRKAGKNPKGGLNAKGRASYKRQTGGTLKAPV